MKFLMDTNVFLRGLVTEEKLNASAQEILKSSSSDLYFSAAGFWEIAIKYALGALSLPKPLSGYIPRALRIWAVRALDIIHEHALNASELPGHHRDPFDRMLVAHAITEQMTLLTADRTLQKYKVDLISCGK